jgi:hypothetical protein
MLLTKAEQASADGARAAGVHLHMVYCSRAAIAARSNCSRGADGWGQLPVGEGSGARSRSLTPASQITSAERSGPGPLPSPKFATLSKHCVALPGPRDGLALGRRRAGLRRLLQRQADAAVWTCAATALVLVQTGSRGRRLVALGPTASICMHHTYRPADRRRTCSRRSAASAFVRRRSQGSDRPPPRVLVHRSCKTPCWANPIVCCGVERDRVVCRLRTVRLGAWLAANQSPGSYAVLCGPGIVTRHGTDQRFGHRIRTPGRFEAGGALGAGPSFLVPVRLGGGILPWLCSPQSSLAASSVVAWDAQESVGYRVAEVTGWPCGARGRGDVRPRGGGR